jgi:glycosyltransferase involved in cell wall biosynthesis
MSALATASDTPEPTVAGERRVLMLNRVGFLGGVERITLTLASGLREYGWRAFLGCPIGGDLAEAAHAQGTDLAPCSFDRMRISANPALLAGYPAAWRRGSHEVKQHCLAQRIDLIHAHHPVTALYALKASRNLGIPIVLHVHETLPAHPLYALAMRLAQRHAAALLCVSAAAQDLAHSLGVPSEKTRIVHNGVDSRFISPAARRRSSIVAAAGPGPHIGVFGVLEPRKAQHLFLEAAAALVSDFPEARFWVIGPAELKDKHAYAKRLERMASMPALRGRVRFPGFQSDVGSWLAAMDVVVQCSLSLESFGMALAEALSLGRPVVASRVGGMPEVVRDGHTGLIVPPGDVPALAAALRRLLGDEQLRRRLGRNASADARARFAPATFCRAVAEAYAQTSGIEIEHGA